MQLHELQPKTARTHAKRVARGGTRGKTAGRGTKGQKARAGHKIRPEVRDTLKKLPKLRGHGKNRARTVSDAQERAIVVNIRALEDAFTAGDVVNPVSLKARGVITAAKSKRRAPVKILGDGELSKRLTVSGCAVSSTAREKIEKAGGSVTA